MINMALWEMDAIIASCILAPVFAYLVFWAAKLFKEIALSIKHEKAQEPKVICCQDCRSFKKYDALCGSCKKSQGLPGVLTPESYCSRGERKED